MPTTRPVGVTLEAARAVEAGALAHARDKDLPPMTVAVLDAAGQLMAFAREDGSSLLRERIVRGKANGALNLGVGSRSLATRAAAHPTFIDSVAALAGGDLVPAAGGVLVRDDGPASSARSESADPCPTTTKPARLPASPPRGYAPTPEPDPTIPASTGAQPMNAYLAKDGTWHIRLADGRELRRHYFTCESARAQIAQLAALR
jgi:uncharacterized protein GlcG (DUF336 family)